MATIQLPEQAEESCEFFARKTTLNSFMRDGPSKQRFMKIIREDAKMVSTWMTELSILCNFKWRSMIREAETDEQIQDMKQYFYVLNTTPIRHILYSIQGKKTNDPMPERYIEMRQAGGLPDYGDWDTFNRSSISFQAIVRFEQNLTDNIQRRMFSRNKRWAKQILKLTTEDALAWTRAVLNGDELFYDYNLLKLSKRPYQYIPLLYQMQEDFFRAGEPSFKVVPFRSHQMQHIDICNTGLEELFQREKGMTSGSRKPRRDPNFQATIRHQWSSLFKVELFEPQLSSMVIFHGISTNGISLSVIMKRQKRTPTTPPKRKTIDANFLLGIDPGYHLPVAGVQRDISGTTNPDSQQLQTPIKITSKEWHQATGVNTRKQRLEAMTANFEEDMSRERELLNNIGSTSPSFTIFTRFELKWFMRKCAIYQQDKITRIKLDKYSRTLSAAAKLANSLCPVGAKTILFWGAAVTSPNMQIKKYVRSANSKILTAFKMLPKTRCEVFEVDEYRTTKCCSRCFAISPPTTKNGHRYQHCAVCNLNINRDINAGINMIMRGLHQHFGRSLQANMFRGVRNVSLIS